MSVTVLTGDALAVLPALPDASVQTCVTSPPYWGLRDYGVTGQLGLERTPEEYVERMVAVFREVRRVLRDDGTLWLNLGDSYAAGGDKKPGRNDAETRNAWQAKVGIARNPARANDGGGGQSFSVSHGLKPKDLVGIPWRVAFALQADGWYLRSDIIWHKPNPMPESVTDRPTKAHEYLFLLAKSARYYYDADAIAEPLARPDLLEQRRTVGPTAFRNDGERNDQGRVIQYANGPSRNARSVWTVATQPFKGSHFAVFPPKLIEPCILAGTSPQACEHCGAPWRRVVERTGGPAPTFSPLAITESGALPDGPGIHRNMGGRYQAWLDANPKQTVGWSPSCACEGATGVGRCVVLDPFGGAGTTGLVADRLGRDAVLIELNPRYAAMARDRITGDAPLFADVNGDAA